MSVVAMEMSMGGEYKFIDKNRLKTVVDLTTIVFKVSILKNELTLVEPNETVYKYRKVE